VSETLVLDSGYRPVDIISWEAAMKRVVEKTVAVVEEYPDRYINTVNWRVNMPSVVRILVQVRRRRMVKFSRNNIFIRDRNTCQYCSHKFLRSQLNIDHVIPRAKGGTTTWENVVCSCIPCNNRKGMRLAHEVGMKLVRQPFKPKKLEDAEPYMQYRKGMPEGWQSYLRNAIYWDAALESDEPK
jgi:5-methylcytosine-specific restriction endonuclease McrA